MKVNKNKIARLKLYEWDADTLSTMTHQYGGTFEDLANALTEARGKGWKNNFPKSHVHGLVHNSIDSKKSTMEAYAEVFNVGFIILPKRFRNGKR